MALVRRLADGRSLVPLSLGVETRTISLNPQSVAQSRVLKISRRASSVPSADDMDHLDTRPVSQDLRLEE